MTHLSVALANYAASGLCKKTAVLEVHAYGELTHWKEAGQQGYFIDRRIHYYPNVKREQIPILINRDYDCIILDFGDEYLSFREEFLHCEKKVILLSLNPWQKFTAVNLLEAMQRKSWGNIQPMYASVHTQKNMKQEIEKLYGIEIFEIPQIWNPVCITPDKFACLEQILCRSAVKAKRKHLPIPIWKKR